MKLYTKSQIDNSFFWDIETIAAYPSLEAMPTNLKDIWMSKLHFKNLERERTFLKEQNQLSPDFEIYEPTADQIYLKYAALYAEFSQILCISFGYFDENGKIAIASIADKDEKIVLTGFKAVLDKVSKLVLTGYNISGFDIPFTIKRMLINGMDLPVQFQIRGKKPWEITINDMMQDWKGTSWDPISLDLLCVTLGIDTPKDLIKNWEVSTNYHNGKLSITDITKYCEKDVKATVDVALSLI